MSKFDIFSDNEILKEYDITLFIPMGKQIKKEFACYSIITGNNVMYQLDEDSRLRNVPLEPQGNFHYREYNVISIWHPKLHDKVAVSYETGNGIKRVARFIVNKINGHEVWLYEVVIIPMGSYSNDAGPG